MSDDPVQGIQSASPSETSQLHKEQQAHAKKEMVNIDIRQDAAKEEFSEWTELSSFNPLAMRKKKEQKTLEKRAEARETEGAKKAAKEDRVELAEIRQSEKAAAKFEKKNSELKGKTLLAIKANIKDDDSAEKILGKVRTTYTDHSLADETLDFLLETTKSSSPLAKQLQEAKKGFNDTYGREIRAGRNIQTQAQEFSKAGLGDPTALRSLYRDITGNPREPHQLFDELTGVFKFPQMKNAIDFILHSLGSDLKAKGPSIPRGELQRLFTEARTLQAFLGLYRFFQKRMPMIENQFDHEEMVLPSIITFELLAKLLMKLLKDRYPSADKILQMAFLLGISEEVAAQIIIFTSYRDAMRQISPKLFKSERHRQDMLMTLIEALSDLEDLLDDDEDEDDDDDEFEEDE